MRIDRLFRRRRASLGMEALMVIPFVVIMILIGRYIFEAVLVRHEVAVHTRGAAYMAAAAESANPVTCRHNSSFVQRPGVTKDFAIVCDTVNGEAGLSAERPLMEAMRNGASAWTDIMRDLRDAGPFNDYRSRGLGAMGFNNPPFLQRKGPVTNQVTHMVPTNDFFEHHEAPWKAAHDPVIWDEIRKEGTYRLFPELFPSRGG